MFGILPPWFLVYFHDTDIMFMGHYCTDHMVMHCYELDLDHQRCIVEHGYFDIDLSTLVARAAKNEIDVTNINPLKALMVLEESHREK